MIWQSGTPFSVFSTRGTLNRGARSGVNTANTTLTKPELDKNVGFFMTGDGPQFINPAAIGPDGRGIASEGSAPFQGQIFFNPPAGSIGALQRRMFSGPWTFNLDLSLVKRTKITETHELELRMEALNFFNHATFYVGDEGDTNNGFVPVFNVNNPSFGTIPYNMYDSRRFQFGLYYRF